MKNILVLCIGNICRSPMAEALLKQALPSHVVRSGGIGALIGNPADPFSIKLMAERGLDINAHRAQQVSTVMMEQADLVLVMDNEQKAYVENQYLARGKVFRLGEFAKVDIPDPYRREIDSFRAALHLIDDGVRHWVQQIKRLG